MSPRRMDISSLLCQDDSAQNEQNTEPLLSQRPLSPPLNDPVILAPHLRGRHVHHQPHPPTATSMTTHKHTTDHPQVLSLTLQPPPTLQHTPSTNTDYPPSSSTKHLHMSQHNSEHADLTSEFPRHPPSSPLTSPAYTERPRTIDALLHHPPGYSRPPPPSQISPTDHYSRPSSSHSPTSAISILNHLPQYSPGSQSPLSSIASYSPTASRDTRQDTISLNTNVSPIHSTHRPIESPIATYKSSRPIPTSRPSPLTLPHTFSRSTPDVLQSSQHRVLSSTFSHPYSPTEMAQQRHASNPNHMAASTSPSAPAPPLAHITPPSAPASAQGKQRSPFLALEALVHVASEERRRISGGSDVSGTGTGGGLNHERGLEREDEFSRGREMELERENEDYAYAHGSTNTNPSLVHDREKPSGSTRHYGYPTIHVPVTASYSAAAGMHSYPQPQPQPQPYSRSHRNSYSSQTSPLHHPPSTSFEDEARPHKRHRESRSPSPSRSRSRSPNARTVAEIRSTDYQSPASTYVTVRRHAHQPYRHVESSGLLVSIPPTPGMLVGGGNNVRVVGPALVAAPFLPPSRSYTTSAPLQHASPRASSYVQPHHPVQVPSPSHHSFPHNQSPQHSPKHPRPQLHHPQSQTALPHSAVHLPTTAESVPPSYGYGPKMAGGVGVLMHDSPPRRNVPKRDLSPGDAARYEGLRHEASREQLKYESMSQQGRYEPSKHVPLQAPVPRLARAVWDNESGRMDEMEVQAPRDNVVCREGVVVPQEQLQLRHPQPPPSPHVHVERPRKRKSEEHVKEVGVSSESLPLPQYRPLRVWEERLPAPEAPQGVSPTPVLYAVNNQVADNISEGCVQQELLGENKREHGEQPAVEDQVNESREEVVDKCVSPPPPSPMRSVSPSLAPVTTRSPTPPVHHACIEPCSPLLLPGAQMAFVASASQSEISHPSLARISYEPRPFLSPAPAQSPLSIKSEPQAPASPPASPAPAPPASPIRDLQSEHLEPELELGHSNTVTSRSRSRSTHTPPPESEPSWSEVEPVPEAVIMHDTIMSDALIQDPSSELAQPPTLAQEPEPLGTPEIRFKLERSPSKSQSRSPSQVPLSIPPPIKKEPNILPEGIPITIPNHSEPSLRRSPKPERSPERPQAVTGSSMMDVDEELLSLVEDRVPASAPALPAKLTSQAKSKSASPFMVGRGAGAGAEQGSSTSADGSSTSASSQLVPKVPAIIADDEKDRESMPPPAPRTKKEKAEKVEKDRGALAAGTAVRSKKKMDGISKVRY
ncbi:hypothetical protein BS17DRAFT_17055 [Gyrodon lividus]|nr:hypothetical protein BS17DRAFT_17055 [Gyrodon lividus]